MGGIKDKVLAAHRAGLKRVILPKRNEKDLEEIPAHIRAELDFVPASTLDEVLNAAFDGGFPTATVTHPRFSSKLWNGKFSHTHTHTRQSFMVLWNWKH